MIVASSVHAKAIELIRLATEMTTEAGSGHPSSAASLAHIVTMLLYRHMRYAPDRPDDVLADRLVLSEGHACPIVYAAAADLGIAIGTDERRPMTREDALALRSVGSEIDGHPNPAEGFPFFPAATGSLGQGLSVAAGLALAARLDGVDRRVYCIIGDGESREGQIWEAADLIAEQRLSAVCPIFNCNGLGQTGEVSPQQSADTLASKLHAFGLGVIPIDGHDPDEIESALVRQAERATEDAPPIAIVARTVKGFGIPALQGDGHHGKPVDEDELEQALRDLEETAERLGAEWSGGTLDLKPMMEVPPTPTAPRRKRPPASLFQALEAQGKEPKDMAPRKAFGLALEAAGREDPRIVVLDGDVGNSTYTEQFQKDEELRARFVQGYIAEQNMVSCAAGLAAGGKRPFVASFGKFLTRAYDQIEMALIGRLPLQLVGTHVGVSLAADGPSQMALPDVAFFRALSDVKEGDEPLFHVLTPSDAVSAYALTLEMAEHPQSCYLRCFRPSMPLLYPDGRFPIGGHRVLAEGKDLLIASCGYMVHEVLKAREKLNSIGVEPTVADFYSLPFDAHAARDLVRSCHGRVLVVEDDYGGPLGSAFAEMLVAGGTRGHVDRMYVTSVPKSGRTPDAVLQHLGLSADHIVERARLLKAVGQSG